MTITELIKELAELAVAENDWDLEVVVNGSVAIGARIDSDPDGEKYLEIL